MNKLLSDEDIIKLLQDIMTLDDIDAYGKKFRDKLREFIEEKMKAHGNMVICEDDEPRNTIEHSRRNFLRQEQRLRNQTGDKS